MSDELDMMIAAFEGRPTTGAPSVGEVADWFSSPDEPTTREKVYNAASAYLRGVGSEYGGSAKGISVAAKNLANILPELPGGEKDKDLEDFAMYQAGQAIEDFTNEIAPGDDRLQESFVFEQLPRAFGSMTAFLLGGGVSRVLKGASNKAVLIMGAGAEATSQYEDAKASGASEEDALRASRWGFLVGSTEALGAPKSFFRVLDRLDKASGRTLRKSLNSYVSKSVGAGFREAVQEFFQTTAGNTIARTIYDRDRKLFEGAVAAGALGGIVGLVTFGLGAAIDIPRMRAAAREISARDPEAVGKLAEKERLSRKDVREALPGVETSAEERGELAEELRSVAAAQSVQPDVLGRPELANPGGENLQARDVMDQVDESMKLAGEPTPETVASWKEEAVKRLTTDYMGEKTRLMAKIREKQVIDKFEVLEMNEIVKNEATSVFATGNLDELSDMIQIGVLARQGRTEPARTMRAMHDEHLSPEERQKKAIGDAMIAPPQNTTELQDWIDNAHKLRSHLQSLGYDLANIDALLSDERSRGRLLVDISAFKGDKWDKRYEYWNNAILSAIPTQMANISGNAVNIASHFTIERFLQTAMNTFVGSKTGPQWWEYRYLLRGAIPGIQRGVVNMIKTWKYEYPYLNYTLGREAQDRIDLDKHKGPAIKGKWGRFVRAGYNPFSLLEHSKSSKVQAAGAFLGFGGWRGLLAQDDFFKTLVVNMEVGARAHRIAKGEGLTGEERLRREEALVADTKSEAWNQAYDEAVELAFQRKTKRIELIAGARKLFPGSRYVLPFVTTPANIFKRGASFTPLGLVTLPAKIYHAQKTGKSSEAFRAVAEQIIGAGIIYWLMGNDERDPFITGSRAESYFDERAQAMRTFQPQTIRIGGKRFSYARIEPFATTVGLLVDWVNAIKSGDQTRIVKVPVESLLGQINNKTFLSGLSDVMNAMDSNDPLDAITKWASSFAVSWLPNIVRTTARAGREDVYPERRVWGKSDEWMERLIRRTGQKSELPIFEDEPKIDLWGRPIERKWFERPSTDWVAKAILPTNIYEENIAKGDRLLVNWNFLNPDDEKHMDVPRPEYTIGGERFYMTDEQYTEFLTISGQLADRMVREATMLNVEKPTQRDIDLLERLIRRARDMARKQIIPRWRQEGQMRLSESSPPSP